MPAPRPHATVRIIGVVLCAVVTLFAAVIAARIPVDDQNHDGRPDVWRSYNRLGQLAEVFRDTNFDGRSDVQEYYERGALVRRDSDLDFNDRVDLVQHFDPVSRQIVRSITDLDADGVADQLLLFRDNQPVYVKHAAAARSTSMRRHQVAPQHTRTGRDPLVPLEDPFSADTALAAVRLVADGADLLGADAPFALPEARGQPSLLARSCLLARAHSVEPSRPSLVSAPLRGPPSLPRA